jgi:hypothetical protein
MKIFSLIKAIPISKNLIKPVVVSLTLFGLFYLILQNYMNVEPWMIFIVLLFFYFIYFVAVLFTRSLDPEDLKILQILEAKTGRKSKILRRLILRFQ